MRSRRVGLASFLVALLLAGCVAQAPAAIREQSERYTEVRSLPEPTTQGTFSVEEALHKRRSGRVYAASQLSIEELGQLFWAAQGLTDQAGHRTAPSAGARYPLEMYALTGDEIMHYLPDGHRVEVGSAHGQREQLGAATFDQSWIESAPAVFVITGVVSRTEVEYGAVASRLMDREAGHAAQNLLLEATALGLEAVPVGGFEPGALRRILLLAPGEEVLYLVPVGNAQA